jgi:hypothetical protein
VTPETDDEDGAPNKHGACLTYVDDFDEWRWENDNAVTDISARAVRQFLREFGNDCAFDIYPSDEGGKVVLTALQCDLSVESSLADLLHSFVANDGWCEDEKASFKRVLQDILKLL